jgi:hypothetical protein
MTKVAIVVRAHREDWIDPPGRPVRRSGAAVFGWELWSVDTCAEDGDRDDRDQRCGSSAT